MAFTYSIVDSFSIAFLLILFFSTGERTTHLTETRCFRTVVMMTVIALLADMVAWQLDGRGGAGVRGMLWCANILCYLLSGAMPLGWLCYTALKMERLNRISKGAWALISAPCIFLALLSLLTPWTGWLFSLDAGNTYHRGPLFVIRMIILFGYLLAAALWTLHRAGNERLHQQRMEYIYLSAFIVFPLIGSVLQLAIYGFSLAWPCAALSLMMIYVGIQNQKISLDALTGLNNRGQFDKFLFNCFERTDSDLSFALFMLDIDNFKKINDTFGHMAGDAALIDAASVLKRSLLKSNAFLARYGGDEFAVVLFYTDEAQVEALCTAIAAESDRHNSSTNAPYKLVFSIGHVCYDRRRYASYQDMITAADAQMYLQKRQHKILR